MTREEFFNALNTGAKWDVGVSIARTNPLPLDANSVFESLEALTDYATDNPLAYPGQLCSVITDTEVAAYQLVTVGTGAVIHKLAASSSTSGNIEGDVQTLQTQVSNILNGTLIAKKAEQDAEGNVISSTYTKQADFSTVKTKVDGIEENAQVNKLEGVQVDGVDLNIDANKKVNIVLSSIYATKEDVNKIPKFDIQVVATLPTADISEATIYLVPCATHDPNTNDSYDEYIYTNSTWEKIGNTDVNLGDYSTTAQMNSAITAAIQGLDVAELAVSASETVKTVSEADGKISVTKQNIQIATSQVTGLDSKITDLTNLQTRVGLDDTTGLSKRIKDVEDKQTSGVVAEASKVTHKLKAGAKEFDGSADVEVTAADLGALTEIVAATDTAIGGILTGYIETNDNRAVKLDETGKAYVTLPAAMTYSASVDGGLEAAANGNNTEFKIKDDGILTAMIKDGQVTNEKIASLNVNKLTQTAGDSLILDGGNAANTNN